MNTYTIINEGNPIIPYTLQVDLDINAEATMQEVITSELTGTSLESFIAGYVANAESGQKNHPDFTTPDTDSNATFTYTDIGENTFDPTKRLYQIDYTFTVSAIATFEKECQSSQEGEELEAFFSSKVAEVEYDFYQARPLWTKTA